MLGEHLIASFKKKKIIPLRKTQISVQNKSFNLRVVAGPSTLISVIETMLCFLVEMWIQNLPLNCESIGHKREVDQGVTKLINSSVPRQGIKYSNLSHSLI